MQVNAGTSDECADPVNNQVTDECRNRTSLEHPDAALCDDSRSQICAVALSPGPSSVRSLAVERVLKHAGTALASQINGVLLAAALVDASARARAATGTLQAEEAGLRLNSFMSQ